MLIAENANFSFVLFYYYMLLHALRRRRGHGWGLLPAASLHTFYMGGHGLGLKGHGLGFIPASIVFTYILHGRSRVRVCEVADHWLIKRGFIYLEEVVVYFHFIFLTVITLRRSMACRSDKLTFKVLPSMWNQIYVFAFVHNSVTDI